MGRSKSGDWTMIFRRNLCTLNIGLMMYGRARWQEAEAIRKYFNIVLIRQDKKFFTFELSKGHSGRNPIDPLLQDNVLIPNNFFASKSGKCTKIRCTWSIFSLLNEKDWSSINQDRTQSSSTIHSQLVVSRKQLCWNLKKSYTRKCMCHLDHRRRFPTKIIGRVIWNLMLQETVKTSNESN